MKLHELQIKAIYNQIEELKKHGCVFVSCTICNSETPVEYNSHFDIF
jgi:hypothetical protein